MLNVTRSGYYAWSERQDSRRAKENQIVSEQMVDIFEASRGSYGSPRLLAAFLSRGF